MDSKYKDIHIVHKIGGETMCIRGIESPILIHKDYIDFKDDLKFPTRVLLPLMQGIKIIID